MDFFLELRKNRSYSSFLAFWFLSSIGCSIVGEVTGFGLCFLKMSLFLNVAYISVSLFIKRNNWLFLTPKGIVMSKWQNP